MSKVRIIPSLLSDGATLVKGEAFKSWRSVGNTQAAARLFELRDVDELMLLDVTATSQGRCVSKVIIEEFASILSIPFAVGGGINSIDEARDCLKAGAEKIVIGTAATLNRDLINTLADEFGNQAIVVAIDVLENNPFRITSKSGTKVLNCDLEDLLHNLEKSGVGEVLVQSVNHDGKMQGMNFESIEMISKLTNLPIIASSGAASPAHFLEAINRGASAVAAGAIFQFTELTPRMVRDYLSLNGISVRKT